MGGNKPKTFPQNRLKKKLELQQHYWKRLHGFICWKREYDKNPRKYARLLAAAKYRQMANVQHRLRRLTESIAQEYSVLTFTPNNYDTGNNQYIQHLN